MIYLVTKQQELFENPSYKVISAEESLSLIKDWEIIQADSETSGIDPYIDKLLCFQLGSKKHNTQIVIDCSTTDICLYKDKLETSRLVFHNGKFDLQFLYKHSIIPRKIYDTMIVEQLLFLGTPKIDFTLEEYEKYNQDYMKEEK
jgi:ribonuclease D